MNLPNSAAGSVDAPAKLSICIATLNRASFIGATLESIFSQNTDDLEVVILDGGSTDGTDRIVTEFQRKYLRLRYIRQATNAGVDRDFNTAVEHATGEYCWLMSDDDFLAPGAIATVLSVIRPGVSLVIANAEVRNADMSRVLRRSQLSFETDRTYTPSEMDRLFMDAGDYLTFIACVIIRRDIWCERRKDEYFGTLFIHVGVIFQSALPGSAIVLAQPLISIRYGNAMWRPREFEIWMFKWPRLIWSLPGLSETAKSRVSAAEPWRKSARLFLYRAKGTYSINEYQCWLRPQLKSRYRRMPAWLVARIPGVLANAVMISYYHLRGGERGMGLLDMRNSRFHFGNWRQGKSES